MIIRGKFHRLGDNVSTDDIIAEKYKSRIMDLQMLIPHLMENLDKEFTGRFRRGDLIVAGKNFGTGSSREVAPAVIQASGCAAILAKSFARIFYRNSFNLGLLLLECDTDQIVSDGDIMVDTEKGYVCNHSKNKIVAVKSPPKILYKVFQEGGVIRYFKKYGQLPNGL